MTNIQLYTADRQLILLSQRVIASGERETVTLTVHTDAAWIGYRLSAIFFRDGQRELTVEVPLDAEGRCTVPRQLLAEPGTLQIGLRGLIGAEEEDIDADAACKTSTLVRYRIAEGIPPEADDRLVNPTNATADEDSVLAGETFYAGESGKPRTGNILTYEEGTPVSIDLTESDPTGPAWAKRPEPPDHDEIGATRIELIRWEEGDT